VITRVVSGSGSYSLTRSNDAAWNPGRFTLCGWVKQAQIYAGTRPEMSSDDRRRLVELERENRDECALEGRLGFSRLSSTAYRHTREVH
jgi:hypothetical protein